MEIIGNGSIHEVEARKKYRIRHFIGKDLRLIGLGPTFGGHYKFY